MGNVYHYTSRLNWELIQNDKFLAPRTRITEKNVRDLIGELVNPKVLAIMYDYPLFTVVIPESGHSGWEEYGLLQHLTAHTTNEVILKFPLIVSQGVLVREHAHWSPKECADLFGVDLFGMDRTGKLTLEQLTDGRVKNQLAKYYNSAVSLGGYDDSYKAPEFWFPHRIPLSVITKVKD